MSEEFIEDILMDTPEDVTPETGTLASSVDSNDVASPEVDSTSVSTEVPSDKEASVPVTSSPEVETLAQQLGWSSDHQGDSFVDASTYILRSKDIQDSMKSHNKELKSQLSGMKSSIDALQQHNERVYRADVSRLETDLAELTQQKTDAIEEGDVAKVTTIDQKINSVVQTMSEPEPKPAAVTNPAYEDWIQDNQWYLNEPEMATYADQVAQQYVGAPADRVYQAVRTKVAELWPDKFTAPKEVISSNEGLAAVAAASSGVPKVVGPTGPVEGGHVQPTTNTFTKADLNDSQRAMMTQFSKLGIMTEDQYIADIAKLQGD